MLHGYHGKILHVDLTAGALTVEEPGEAIYRKYLGGTGLGAYYLFKHTPPHADPLGPENTLSLITGPVAGAAIPGQSRVGAIAVSPLTGVVGEASGGGFWAAELKNTGFDGIVIRGQAARPVYLWVHDGQAELRDAASLWGKFAAEVEDAIRGELSDPRIHVLQCGPAAEAGVRFGALINNANRANGRSGMGTVMASKRLKAIAVRGSLRPHFADPKALSALARWGAQHLAESSVSGMHDFGTANVLLPQNLVGGLPTRNWSSGVFEGAGLISGPYMAETIRPATDTCFACVVACKPVTEVTEGPFSVERRYGGPEYETLATLGSYCGVSDVKAVARANQLCNMYGMDTISCGATVAWAMDCYEHGLITREQTGGIDLRFGNAEAMVRIVELIGVREGFGAVLGEGSARAAQALGVGQELVAAIKGRELPAHMPQVKRSLALMYAVNPGGADHTVSEHDPDYAGFPERMAELDLLDPQPANALNAEKVRYALYTQRLVSAVDSASLCWFVFGGAWQLYGPSQFVEAIAAATGWNVSLWELMKVGERRINLMRAFNARDGVGAEADVLPAKLLKPLVGGPSDGVAVPLEEFEAARATYYRMAGWDERGHPTRAKLEELALGWVADELGG
ncbi:MAG: aldehyde ferredoxin oxidoreductase family protein [Chloroflexi bacterium]|nr:aldehyde ferredoxin oxidoreductase family protein [Chloroflexota bacterium]